MVEANSPDESNPQQRPPDSSGQRSLIGRAKQAIDKASTGASSGAKSLGAKTASLSLSGMTSSVDFGKRTSSAAGEKARGALDIGNQAYSGSKLESAVNYIDSEFEKRGTKQAIKETTEAVVGKLDQVTGKQLLELLERKLQLQDAYNDVLATRLAEALERIAELETRLTRLVLDAPSTIHSSSAVDGGQSQP